MSRPPGRVVVIGGGVIGVACAHYLARAGWQVTVIDRGKVGGGSSHANCGLVCPSHVLPLAEPGAIGRTLKAMFQPNAPFSIKPRLDPSLWWWLLHFARRCNHRDMMQSARGIQPLLESSRPLFRELMEKDSLACEWETRGLLFVYRDAKAFAAYADTDRLLRDEFHCPAHRVDGDSVAQLEPALQSGLAGGWHYEDDAQLRPDRLMDSWRRLLERAGVTIHEHRSFRRFICRDRQAIAALTDASALAGDAFVIAAGAETPLVQRALGCRIPIQPGKGYSMTMPRPRICPAIPLIFPETRVAVTPFQSGYRLGSTMEFAGYDAALNRRRLQLLKDGAAPYLREPYCGPVEEEWCGWRPMTYDSLPIIDRSPAMANVLIAAGHNMLGLSMAPATGKLVAELLTDAKPHLDPTPYRLSRFGVGGA